MYAYRRCLAYLARYRGFEATDDMCKAVLLNVEWESIREMLCKASIAPPECFIHELVNTSPHFTALDPEQYSRLPSHVQNLVTMAILHQQLSTTALRSRFDRLPLMGVCITPCEEELFSSGLELEDKLCDVQDVYYIDAYARMHTTMATRRKRSLDLPLSEVMFKKLRVET
jgi:hypothetical protein